MARLRPHLEADAAVLARLGIQVGAVAEGHVELYIEVTDSMVNMQGVCHGGLLFALADTACAYVLATTGGTPATVDASMTYLRPAPLGERVTAIASIVKSGKRMGFTVVRLEDREGDLLATFRGTCAL